MAHIRSLGVHDPSALDYMIREGHLKQDPRPQDYKWQVYTVYDGQNDAWVEEETLRTDKCVVWSRGGVVKRTYGVDVEGEIILDAFVTSFRRDDNAGSETAEKTEHSSSHQEYGLQREEPAASPTGSFPDLCRALAVVLQTQAHIFFLSGDTHVIPLPFEVEAAMPAPIGFVLQRKLPKRSSPSFVPPVPPNSFASPIATRNLFPSSSFGPNQTGNPRPSLTISTAPGPTSDRVEPESIDTPNLFYLLDPRAEVGIVTAARNTAQKTSKSVTKYNALDPNDHILYLSTKDELGRKGHTNHPLFLAVTSNTKSNVYTVWKVAYHTESDTLASANKRRLLDSTTLSRRRSSKGFGLNAGSTTPTHRGPTSIWENAENLAHSYRDLQEKGSSQESKAGDLEQLASQLGPEFGEVGVQTRGARRVSSMLARTDLVTNQDRPNFHDVAGASAPRSSTGRAFRRGESLSGFGDRLSFGPGRQSSVYGNGSMLSQGSSFLDVSAEQLLQNLNDHGDIRGFEDMNLQGYHNNFSKEVLFTKLQEIPRTRSLPGPNHQIRSEDHVFTILSPPNWTTKSTNKESEVLSVSIVQRESKEIIVLSIRAGHSRGSIRLGKETHGEKPNVNYAKENPSLKVTDIRRGSNILDACKIQDGTFSRMLLLTETRDGNSILSVEAPWGTSFRLDLPKQFRVHDPFSIAPDTTPLRRRDGSLKRVISDPLDSFTSLVNVSSHGRFDLIDREGKRHRLELALQPNDSRVARILQVADFLLQDHGGDGLLTTWWEVLRWMRTSGPRSDDEWIAMLVTIFCMAMPFISAKQPRRSPDSKRKKTASRQSISNSIQEDAWTSIHEHVTSRDSSWIETSSWRWTDNLTKSAATASSPQKQSLLLQCTDLARDFLQTPAGETAHGPEGSLPTAISKSLEARKTSLATLLVGFHLLYEEDKLNIHAGSGPTAQLRDLVPMLAQIGRWLGWEAWTWKSDTYYATEIHDIAKNEWLFEDTQIDLLDIPQQPFEPPSIYAHFEDWLRGTAKNRFLTLSRVAGLDPNVPSTLQKARSITPRLHLWQDIEKGFSRNGTAYGKVKALAGLPFNQEILSSLPEAVKALIHEILAQTQADPPTSWLESALKLVDRDDLVMNRTYGGGLAPAAKVNILPHHEAVRDYHSIANTTLETEPYHFFDSSAEADRQLVTRLIYHADRRFQEAAKLVNQLRPPVAECNSEPEWTESELLEAQKDLVQLVTLRTLAVSSGRGMMNFSSRIPLLTDKVPIPAFTLQCHMRPMNVTFSADRAAFTEEKVCWAFFHNGVSTGLTISKSAKGIDTSWILFNKPPELTNRHAGFLLGLGLNGHLKALAKWVAFKYLTPKHTMVSIGLLLGLSASYLGTMDTLITRLLSVHVTRMLPPGAAELNLSPLTQTAGIMGLGLLYANSQHRRMSEVMVSEIENTDVEESPSVLRDEGYRLAAGFALGFINLGKGRDLRGVHDMNIVERLLFLAIGTKNVNLVHVLDRATAGATVATALIFMKTDNETIANKIDVPDTLHQFDYVRPDIFLLRTVARHLIMWSSIDATESWIAKSLPRAYRKRVSLTSVTRLSSEDMPFFNILAGLCLVLGLRYAGSASHKARDLLIHYLDQFIRLTRLTALNYDAKLTRNSVRNCQDVVALGVSAVMAGSGDLEVFRRLRSLHGRIDSDTPYGSHLAAHMAIGALFLGGGTHTFSTSDVAIAALFCSFYPIFPTFVLDNKAHLQAFRHFWVLAAEPRCLIPREVSTQRPINVPLSITLKSGTVGRLTAPCLLPPLSTISTIRTSTADFWTVTLDFETIDALPISFQTSQSIFLRRRSPYDAVSSTPSSTFVSALQAHADADPTPSVSATASTTAMTSARAIQHGSASSGPLGSNASFEWLFELASFRDLDVAEQALLLPVSGSSTMSSKTGLVRASVIDTKLTLERGTLPHDLTTSSGKANSRIESHESMPANKQKLWQLRLLFAWLDQLDSDTTSQVDQTGGSEVPKTNTRKPTFQDERQHGNESMWLRRQVIERLRWRVWKLGNEVHDEEEDDEDADEFGP